MSTLLNEPPVSSSASQSASGAAPADGATPAIPLTPVPFKPARSKINVRLFVFLAVISLPFLALAYVGAKSFMNRGVEDHGTYKKVDLKALGFFQFDQS